MGPTTFNICLPLALAFALTACGSDSDDLAPKTSDGAPTYEQLNPPVPPSENSSMAPDQKNQQDR